MLKPKFSVKKSALLAGIGGIILLAAGFTTAAAAESGCVTCHLDKEMLIKTAKIVQGQKSALQSGAG